jgi:hypothetical protein
MNLNALIVIINSKGWYWRILRNLKNGFALNVAVMKRTPFIFMKTYIPWIMNMLLDALVVGEQVETTFNLNRIKTGFIKHKGLIIK